MVTEDAPTVLTEEAQAKPLELAVLLAHKIGLPDYSSAEVSLPVSHITVETTDEEIALLVERGKIAFGKMGERVAQLATEARAKKGWG